MLPKPIRILLKVFAAIVGLIFATTLFAIFRSDPTFPPLPKMTQQQMAAFFARFAQPYHFETRSFTMRDGKKLHAQDHHIASNDTIVLVHGVLSSSVEMNRAAGMLRDATGAEVVALDLRGHGNSDGAPGDVDYIGQYEDDLSDVVKSIRNTKRGGRVILAGHSMGGGVALRYAMRRDVEPVDGYLLFSPHMGLKSPTMRLESKPGAPVFMQLHLSRVIGLSLLNMIGITSFNGLQTLFFNLPPEVPLRSYSFRAMVGMSPDDYVPAVKAIHQPLLVLVGSNDEAFRADQFERAVHPFCKSGEVTVINGPTHDGVMTDVRTMARAKEWMRENAKR